MQFQKIKCKVVIYAILFTVYHRHTYTIICSLIVCVSTTNVSLVTDIPHVILCFFYLHMYLLTDPEILIVILRSYLL